MTSNDTSTKDNKEKETVQSSKDKIEKAEELLREAHKEIGYPDNSLIGPAIGQIEAHQERHYE